MGLLGLVAVAADEEEEEEGEEDGGSDAGRGRGGSLAADSPPATPTG